MCLSHWRKKAYGDKEYAMECSPDYTCIPNNSADSLRALLIDRRAARLYYRSCYPCFVVPGGRKSENAPVGILSVSTCPAASVPSLQRSLRLRILATLPKIALKRTHPPKHPHRQQGGVRSGLSKRTASVAKRPRGCTHHQNPLNKK
jgi:hypothetical protein